MTGRTEPNEPMRYHHSNPETTLDNIADAYAAMDERRAIKSLVRIGST